MIPKRVAATFAALLVIEITCGRDSLDRRADTVMLKKPTALVTANNMVNVVVG
ncbi:MAG: hypothetical protein ABI625_21875 [bacterium]